MSRTTKDHGLSDWGAPFLSLSDKIDALKHCLTMPCDSPIREDAMGHLMDLIYHIAPGWEFGDLKGIEAIKAHYGKYPTPIAEDN